MKFLHWPKRVRRWSPGIAVLLVAGALARADGPAVAVPEHEPRIRLIEEGRLDTGPWITHRLPLEAVPEGFAELPGKPGLVKAMIEVGGEAVGIRP